MYDIRSNLIIVENPIEQLPFGLLMGADNVFQKTGSNTFKCLKSRYGQFKSGQQLTADDLIPHIKDMITIP